MTALLTTTEIAQHVRELKRVGCKVIRDNDAGTVEAREGDTVVFMAIQKGRNGPWITRYTKGQTISWENPADGRS